MNDLQALITRRTGRELAFWYSHVRGEGRNVRLPSLAELGQVAGFVVLLVMVKR